MLKKRIVALYILPVRLYHCLQQACVIGFHHINVLRSSHSYAMLSYVVVSYWFNHIADVLIKTYSFLYHILSYFKNIDHFNRDNTLDTFPIYVVSFPIFFSSSTFTYEFWVGFSHFDFMHFETNSSSNFF